MELVLTHNIFMGIHIGLFHLQKTEREKLKCTKTGDKMMTVFEKECFGFVRELTETLAKDYEFQHEKMEEFARWNLPEETALEWIDAEGMIEVLEAGNCLPPTSILGIQTILKRFYSAFKTPDNPVWTHEAMQKDDFWREQRITAKEVLKVWEKAEL